MTYLRSVKRLAAICLLLALTLCAAGCSRSVEIATTDAGTPCVVNMAAVGDILMTEDQLSAVRKADGSYDFAPVFSSVSADLVGADLTVGNFEGNLCGDPADAATFNYPTALAEALRDTGFDVLQTANTYSVENGLSGLRSTKSILSSCGIQTVGTFSDADDRSANAVTIVKVNGIKIAFVAFTKGVNNVRLPDGADYCVNLLYRDYDSNYNEVDRSQIASCMEEASKQKPDVIVAMVHWGSEYSEKISQTQEEIESVLLQNGADVILGTHSHLVGKMEQKKVTLSDGTKKTAFVAYSLGNFYCDSYESDAQTSLILNLEFTKYTDGSTRITNAAYTPVYIADHGKGTPVRYQVLNARNAIRQYDDNYYDRVSPEIYEQIRSSIEDLSEQMEWNFKAP